MDRYILLASKVEDALQGHRPIVCRADYSPGVLRDNKPIETTWAWGTNGYNGQIDLVIKTLQHLNHENYSSLEVNIDDSFWEPQTSMRTLDGRPWQFDEVFMLYDLLAHAKGVPIKYDATTQRFQEAV